MIGDHWFDHGLLDIDILEVISVDVQSGEVELAGVNRGFSHPLQPTPSTFPWGPRSWGSEAGGMKGKVP